MTAATVPVAAAESVHAPWGGRISHGMHFFVQHDSAAFNDQRGAQQVLGTVGGEIRPVDDDGRLPIPAEDALYDSAVHAEPLLTCSAEVF